MKCPFCAEEIKDEAVLCRFCGARLVEGKWEAPAAVAARPLRVHPSSFTIRTAGFFFMLSAVFEAFSLTSPVVLTGDPIIGAAAIGYHTFYIGLFLAMGYALWSAQPWGFYITLAGTIIYSLEKLCLVFNSGGRVEEISKQLDTLGAKDVVDPGYIVSTLNTANILFICCWWGFVIFLYFKRDFFKNPKSIEAAH